MESGRTNHYFCLNFNYTGRNVQRQGGLAAFCLMSGKDSESSVRYFKIAKILSLEKKRKKKRRKNARHSRA